MQNPIDQAIPLDPAIRVNGVDFPEHDFCLYTIPKNGGTSLWTAAYQMRFGHHPRQNVYSYYEKLMGDGSKRRHRFVVVRDPIDRFLSGYRFLVRHLELWEGEELDFDTFVARFPELYRRHAIHHHLMPQFYFVRGTPLSAFTEVIRFSELPRLFDRMEELSGKPIERLHLNKSAVAEPPIEHWHLDFLQLFYDVDYAMGYCERSSQPPLSIENYDADGQAGRSPSAEAPTAPLHPR